MNSTKLKIQSLGAAVAISVMAATGAPAEAQFYKGKSVTMIVGFGAGSGVTTTARILSKHLAKHIPGEPNVIVKNLPGAGSVRANNFVYEKAKPDGLTIIFGPVFAFNQIISAPGVRFKFNDFTYIGGSYAAERVMFMRRDAVPGGAKTPADIVKAKDLKLVATAATGILSLHSRPALDLMGVKYIFIPGHRGGGAVRNAVRQGTGNIAAHGLSGYRAAVQRTQIQDGTAIPLWYFPAKNPDGTFQKESAAVTDMPSFLDVYREVHGKEPSGPHWKFLSLVSELDTLQWAVFGPPKMNKEAAADLITGYEAALGDPALQAEYQKVVGSGHRIHSRAFAAKYFETIKNLDPAMVKYAKEYIGAAAKAPRRGKKGKAEKKG
ncbi:MAG: hypothetical protein O3A84_16605 [Proteobacteria bacterium]|nr:hypothetical protein [Pseudomonadota bacterium]